MFLFYLFFHVDFQNLQYSNVDNVSLKDKGIPTSPKCVFPQKLFEEPSSELFFLFFCTYIFHNHNNRGNRIRELEREERENPRINTLRQVSQTLMPTGQVTPKPEVGWTYKRRWQDDGKLQNIRSFY